MSFSVRSRNRSSGTRTCATCIHDGQCDGLPNCGGSCWEPDGGRQVPWAKEAK